MKSFFRFIEWIFHPIWVNIMLLAVIIQNNHFITERFFSDQRWVLIALFFLSMGILPLFVMWMLMKKDPDQGGFSQMSLSLRSKSLALMVLLIALHALVFSRVRDLDFLSVYFKSALMCWLMIQLFNQFFRISFHAAGAGMIPVVLWFLWPYTTGWFWPFLLFGAVISMLIPLSRFVSKQHTSQELISGYLIGFSVPMLIFAMYYGL